MRLLIVSGAYPPMAYGEAPNTRHLARRLAAAGVEVHVLTRAIEDYPADDGVVVHAVMRDWSWRRVPQLRRMLKRISPDAILLMYVGAIYDSHPMTTFLPSIAKRVLPGVRVATRFENPLSQAAPGRQPLPSRLWRRWMAHRFDATGVHYASGTLLRDSDAVIVLCRHHLALLVAQDPSVADKAWMTPPPANMEVISDPDGRLRDSGRRRLGCGSGTFLLGYLGYAYQNKGIETLLRAVALLMRRGRDLRLVILGGPIAPSWPGDDRGSTYYDGVRRLGETLGIAGDVVWHGSFSSVDREIASLVHAVDAFVLPFDNGVHLNNSSVGLLSSYGAALVTTAREHTDEQFVNGRNVMLCEPGNPSALADLIERLIDEPALLRQLRLGARALADECFSWDSAVTATLETLEREGAAGGGRPRGVRPALQGAP